MILVKEYKEVSENDFDKFIAAYKNELEKDVSSKHYIIRYYDHSLSKYADETSLIAYEQIGRDNEENKYFIIS